MWQYPVDGPCIFPGVITAGTEVSSAVRPTCSGDLCFREESPGFSDDL